MSILVHLSILVISGGVGVVGGCTAYAYLLIAYSKLPDTSDPAILAFSAGPSLATAAALYAALHT